MSFSFAYNGMSFKKKILIFYLIFGFLPTIILQIYYTLNINNSATDQIGNTTALSVAHAVESINENFQQMHNSVASISHNPNLKQILSSAFETQGSFNQFLEIKEIQDILNNYMFFGENYLVKIYIDDKIPYSNRTVDMFPLSLIEEESFFKGFESGLRPIYFSNPLEFTYSLYDTNFVISAYTPIKSTSNQIVGAACVDIPMSDVISTVRDFYNHDKTDIVFIDNENKYLYSDTLSVSKYMNEYEANIKQIEANSYKSLADKFIVVSEQLENGMKFALITDEDELFSAYTSSIINIIIIGLSVMILTYLAATAYSNYITKSLTNLVGQMKKVRDGDLSVRCTINSMDEIGELENNFNYMVEEMNLLLSQRYETGKSLKDFELKALQAQINPHFLYNTLDLIYWISQKNNDKDVCDIVIKMSKFYRLVLSGGEDFITVQDEFTLTQLYVDLQNLRFKTKINLICKIDEEIKDFGILKLMLQPIVENSIIHGIRESAIDKPEILLSFKKIDDMIEIIIKDNGRGISKDNIVKLMHDEKENVSKKGGYGIYNIMERLKSFYGDNHYFNIESKLNEYTLISIKVPYDDYRKL